MKKVFIIIIIFIFLTLSIFSNKKSNQQIYMKRASHDQGTQI